MAASSHPDFQNKNGNLYSSSIYRPWSPKVNEFQPPTQSNVIPSSYLWNIDNPQLLSQNMPPFSNTLGNPNAEHLYDPAMPKIRCLEEDLAKTRYDLSTLQDVIRALQSRIYELENLVRKDNKEINRVCYVTDDLMNWSNEMEAWAGTVEQHIHTSGNHCLVPCSPLPHMDNDDEDKLINELRKEEEKVIDQLKIGIS